MTGPSLTSERTEVAAVAEPRPGAGEISIDVAYAGLNYLDVMARRGDPGYTSGWPSVPGVEVSGVVREVGSGVESVRVGDRVAAFPRGSGPAGLGGGLAQVSLARAELVVPLPDEVDLATAAAAPLMMSTAWMLLTDAARLQPGDTVLMHSASGGIGSAVAQLVPLLGGTLSIGTVGRPEKVEPALRSGWDVAIPRSEGLVQSVRTVAGGGVDVVLDPLGTDLVEADIDMAAPGGRIVLFGNAGGGPAAALPPLGVLIKANVALVGFSITSLTRDTPRRVTAALRHVLDLTADRSLEVPVQVVDGLDAAPGVLQLLSEGRGQGKYVVAVGSFRT